MSSEELRAWRFFANLHRLGVQIALNGEQLLVTGAGVSPLLEDECKKRIHWLKKWRSDMAFKKLNTAALPARQWALVGYPGSGKSTFAAQLRGPLLVVDADHRFGEVARLAAGDVFTLSDDPSDMVIAERIVAHLRANMAGSGVKTIVVDSLTAILAPLVTEAVLSNDAGVNKNRIAAFKGKALALRLLQDAITGWGCDVLWVYHLRGGLDAQARPVENTSISAVELARLRRSLNVTLRCVQEGGRCGIKVDWARSGRQGMTLWDESGCWRDMPQRIEEAVYGGLSAAEMDARSKSTPEGFASAADAIAWGFEQNIFADAAHAKNAYDKLKADVAPTTAAAMWQAWIAEVQQRRNESAP